MPNPKLKFLEQCREVMRFRQLAYRTEETYLQWIRRFVLFHRRAGEQPGQWVWRHPRDLGEPELRAFLTDLAARRQVTAGTQNQALSALLFLYREVLGVELEWVTTPMPSNRLPPALPLSTTVGRFEDCFSSAEANPFDRQQNTMSKAANRASVVPLFSIPRLNSPRYGEFSRTRLS